MAKINRKTVVPVPRFHTEVLQARVARDLRPFGLGVRDTQTGQIVAVHPLNSPILKELLPEAAFFRTRSNEEILTSVMSLGPDGKKGAKISADDLTQKLLQSRHQFPAFDSFKNEPNLSIIPLRYNQQFGVRGHAKQGYALIDDKSGAIMRYVSEEDMRSRFAQIGCHKVRVGKYGNITSLDLADGGRMQAKDFIDGLLGTVRATPRKSRTPLIASTVGAAAAFAIAGAALQGFAPSQPSMVDEFNNMSGAQQYGVTVIKREAGADPMASYDAIKDEGLRNVLSNWMIDGSYAPLAMKLNELGIAKIEADNPYAISVIDNEIKETERKMLWPVEVARAIDTFWNRDEAKLRRLGFTSPSDVFTHALATTEIESVFGTAMTMPLNPTVEGFYHFNDNTFMATKASYERKYGRLDNVPRDRGSALEFRNDPYVSTLMFLEYTHMAQAGRNNPEKFYRRHVLGPGGASLLERNPNVLAASLLPAAAGDNPGIFGGRVSSETLGKIDGRFAQAEGKVSHTYGFNDDERQPITLPRSLFSNTADFTNAANGGSLNRSLMTHTAMSATQAQPEPVRALH